MNFNGKISKNASVKPLSRSYDTTIFYDKNLLLKPITALKNRQKVPETADLIEALEWYYDLFRDHFINQQEGSLKEDIDFEISRKMRKKIGLCFLFERKIRFNFNHFVEYPESLPYSLFHELTHMWLYDCDLDPNHTWRFYEKMSEYEHLGLPVDEHVHIHSKLATEARCIYRCPNCENRWFVHKELDHYIFCGLCYDQEGKEYFAELYQKPERSIEGAKSQTVA